MKYIVFGSNMILKYYFILKEKYELWDFAETIFFVRKDIGKYFCLMCSCASQDLCPVLFANTQFLWQIIACEYAWFT